MAHVKTSSGFECEIDEGAINDFELLEAIRGTQKDDPLALVDVVNKLFTPHDKKALYDMHRDKLGRVDIPGVTNDIGEALASLNSTKK